MQAKVKIPADVRKVMEEILSDAMCDGLIDDGFPDFFAEVFPIRLEEKTGISSELCELYVDNY